MIVATPSSIVVGGLGANRAEAFTVFMWIVVGLDVVQLAVTFCDLSTHRFLLSAVEDNSLTKIAAFHMESVFCFYLFSSVANLSVAFFLNWRAGLVLLAVYLMILIHCRKRIGYVTQSSQLTCYTWSYRTLSLSLAPINVILMLINYIPWELARHRACKGDDHDSEAKETNSVVQTNPEEIERGEERRQLSRLELLSYLGSLAVDVYVAVDLILTLRATPAGSVSAGETLALMFAGVLAPVLIGIDLANLRKAVGSRTDCLDKALGADWCSNYDEETSLQYIANSRIEAYLLASLLMLVGISTPENYLNMVLIGFDYVLVTIRSVLKLRTLPENQEFDWTRLYLREDIFPFGFVRYAGEQICDMITGILHILCIVRDAYRCFLDADWTPEFDGNVISSCGDLLLPI